MKHAAWLSLGLFAVGTPLFTGCSAPGTGDGGCTVTPFVAPSTVTLDHSAPAAQNTVQFTAGETYAGTHCAIPAVLVNYQWTLSDTIDASITSGPGVSNPGTATCLQAALNPITVTPSPSVGGLTATLICK
jgi:hypothetical protein